MMFTFTVTDTYGWVNLVNIQLSVDTSNRELVRRAKAWAGWTGVRCAVDNTGDTITIRPRKMNQIMFIDSHHDH